MGLESSMREGPSGPRGGWADPRGKAKSSTISFWNRAGSVRVEAYCRSHPAQNVPPVPQNTPTLASLWSNSSKAATRASAVSGSTALLASGRLLMMV